MSYSIIVMLGKLEAKAADSAKISMEYVGMEVLGFEPRMTGTYEVPRRALWRCIRILPPPASNVRILPSGHFDPSG